MRIGWQLVKDDVMNPLDRKTPEEMKPLRVQEEPLLAQKEPIPHLGQFSFRRVLASLLIEKKLKLVSTRFSFV